MTITIKIPETAAADLLPPKDVLAQAGARAVSNLIVRHLRERNRTHGNTQGFPRSDYWADVADSVSVMAVGDKAQVVIDHAGAALHLEGGTVRPSRGRALAIPISARVYGVWPSEFGGGSRDALQLVWPKGNNVGFLRDPETDEMLYMLVGATHHRPDPTVLPTENEMTAAAGEAMEGVMAQ